MSKFLDEDGVFLRGSWRGELLTDVADEDPDYLGNLLEEGFIDAEDRRQIEEVIHPENNEEEGDEW